MKNKNKNHHCPWCFTKLVLKRDGYFCTKCNDWLWQIERKQEVANTQ